MSLSIDAGDNQDSSIKLPPPVRVTNEVEVTGTVRLAGVWLTIFTATLAAGVIILIIWSQINDGNRRRDRDFMEQQLRSR